MVGGYWGYVVCVVEGRAVMARPCLCSAPYRRLRGSTDCTLCASLTDAPLPSNLLHSLPSIPPPCLPVPRCPLADIGMEEAGIAEAIAAAVQAAHPHLHGLLWSNVLLTGGWGWPAALGLAAPRRPLYM